MKTIVYLTKNLINHKIYIGIHDCEDPNIWDYYLGCGAYANRPSTYNKCETPFQAAVFKYGPSNFRRVILKVFNTRKEALKLEALLVDEAFVRRRDTYNVALGGGNPLMPTRHVYQYDLKGKFLLEFTSVTAASKATGVYAEGIRIAANTERICAGFFWSYTKTDILDISNYSMRTNKVSICAYNEELLEIGEFSSYKEAGDFFDFDPKMIANSVYHRHKCHGIWFVPFTKTIEETISEFKNFHRIGMTKVYSYDAGNGNFLEEFDTIAAACKKYNRSHSSLLQAIRLETKCAGLRWSYYKVDNIYNVAVDNKPNKPKQIGQYDESDNLIKIWDISECKKLYKNVIRVCRGSRNKAYGYKWKYIDSELS